MSIKIIYKDRDIKKFIFKLISQNKFLNIKVEREVEKIFKNIQARGDKALFDYALDLIGAQPDQSAHVGDDYEGDVVGAINAGLFPVFLDRNNLPEDPNKHITSIHSLKELIPLFK